ncbi:MAG: Ig-like domain-containing protein [Acetivibrio sp.]
MKNVSFIIKRVVMFTCALALASLLPLHNNVLSNNAVAAQASEVKGDKPLDARLTYTTMKLVVNNSCALSVRNLDRDAGEVVTFKSSDTDVVSAKKDSDSKATIEALKVGEATITVTIRDAKKKTIKNLECNVVVGPPAISVKFSEAETKVKLSDESSTTLKAVLKPGSTEEKPKITVSKDGVVLVSDEASVTKSVATITVKAVEIGKVTLTITIDCGVSDTCTIQVVE